MILADGGQAYADLGRRAVPRHPGLPAGRQHRPRRHRRGAVRASRSASWSRATAAAPAPAGRCAPSRSAGRSARTCRRTRFDLADGLRGVGRRPRRWSATAGSWSSTTPSTWRGRRGSRWSSAPRSRAASARPAGSARCAASRRARPRSSPAATSTRNLVLARGPVRDHDRRLAVRHGRPHPDARAERHPALRPEDFDRTPQEASHRMTAHASTPHATAGRPSPTSARQPRRGRDRPPRPSTAGRSTCPRAPR